MRSLISQTYHDIEILVIDDSSLDNSVELLRRYESDARVTLVVRQSNSGWVAIGNLGLALASGEFVLFANCDDDCAPHMIERLVDAMQNNPSAGIAYCRSLLIDESGNELGDDYSIRESRFRTRCKESTLLSGEEMALFLLYSCVIPNLSGALFRRAWLSEAGGFSTEYKVCSDWELFFRIVSNHDVHYTAEAMNLFRQHEASIRSATRERTVNGEYIRLLLKQRKRHDISLYDDARIRLRIMSMWAGSLISRSCYGLRNTPHYVALVTKYDPLALLFVPPALALRCLTVLRALFLGGVARAVGSLINR